MRYNISRIVGTIFAFPVAVIAWLVSFFAFDFYFLVDLLISVMSFAAIYIPTQRVISGKYLKEIGLSRRDYMFVNNQLQHAQDKVRRILKSYINIRSLKDFKQINEIYRISRAITSTVKERSAKFFTVESFFYSHIDNALNLIDAYTRLAKTPKKSAEDKQKLEQTRITLDEVKRTLVADLRQLNEEDYAKLDIEMEVNKLEQKRYEKMH